MGAVSKTVMLQSKALTPATCPKLVMPSQWENLFKNAGTWNGCFTRFTATGTRVSDTPSCLTLEQVEPKRCRFQLTRYPEGQEPQSMESNFTSLARSGMFFAEGSFSKGSMQRSPVSQFGTEFGLTLPDARLRLVQIFQPGGDLDYVVVIRETREGAVEVERPVLDLEQLVGTWRGQAIHYFNDWTTSDPIPTELKLTRSLSHTIQQEWQLGTEGSRSQLSASNNSRWLFEQGGINYQLLCLPGGGASLCPQSVRSRTAFHCELSWLVDPQTRLRVIRWYKADGAWDYSTWVREEKVA